ncbi:MAG: hypothetical protein MUF14_01010 [Hyphomonadaceae bacterium]|nr:hypothetical protein [Hyphomonadaceae bacterium]
MGGRGGRVIRVTSLEDSGPGTLRAAIETRGPRTVIFDIGGTIILRSPLVIRHPNITIAGQTAPGGGITLRGQEFRVSSGEVIVRFLRIRVGDEQGIEADALSLTSGRNIIIDHCSASWSTDETLSVSQRLTRGEGQLDLVTVQWSIITESLDRSVHSKGAHGYGSLVRGSAGSRYSFHHNLWAHHRARMPRPGNFTSPAEDSEGPVFDFTNNVFYNWGGDDGDASGYNVDEDAISRYNFRSNAYLTGPQSLAARAFVESAPGARAHFSGNSMNGATPDQRSLVRLRRSEVGYFSETPFDTGGLLAVPADQALRRVLALAGASRVRDAVDARVVASLETRSGRIIDSQRDVGGWPVLDPGRPWQDNDSDGMPDDWERANGLEPANPADGPADADRDGYTNLEEWMNSLVPAFSQSAE